ncbi:hypothetical protein Sango_2291400 [Sesamum angolense]|uniref:Uncharacterized protein n=1 Tax=Sesamum angolense TaxID=2727404 RepID=A0AAE1WA15_9LAMI|nr:hypothetical protein Sango_2291400 [Sesamum angolense]
MSWPKEDSWRRGPADRPRNGESKNSKQAITVDPTMKAKYIVASEVGKEAVWMKNYIQKLGVVPSVAEPMVTFRDKNGAIAQAKELMSHHRSVYS